DHPKAGRDGRRGWGNRRRSRIERGSLCLATILPRAARRQQSRPPYGTTFPGRELGPVQALRPSYDGQRDRGPGEDEDDPGLRLESRGRAADAIPPRTQGLEVQRREHRGDPPEDRVRGRVSESRPRVRVGFAALRSGY